MASHSLSTLRLMNHCQKTHHFGLAFVAFVVIVFVLAFAGLNLSVSLQLRSSLAPKFGCHSHSVCLLRIDASLKLASIVGDDSASCGVRLTSAGEVFSDQASIDA